jgi:hypothetical protein
MIPFLHASWASEVSLYTQLKKPTEEEKAKFAALDEINHIQQFRRLIDTPRYFNYEDFAKWMQGNTAFVIQQPINKVEDKVVVEEEIVTQELIWTPSPVDSIGEYLDGFDISSNIIMPSVYSTSEEDEEPHILRRAPIGPPIDQSKIIREYKLWRTSLFDGDMRFVAPQYEAKRPPELDVVKDTELMKDVRKEVEKEEILKLEPVSDIEIDDIVSSDGDDEYRRAWIEKTFSSEEQMEVDNNRPPILPPIKRSYLRMPEYILNLDSEEYNTTL